MLVAEVGDGYAVDQMAPQGGGLLDRRRVLAGPSHGETPDELQYNSGGASLHFRLKQNTSCGGFGIISRDPLWHYNAGLFPASNSCYSSSLGADKVSGPHFGHIDARKSLFGF